MARSFIQTDWRELFRHAVAGWDAQDQDKVERLDDACNAVYRRLREECIADSLRSEEQGELRDALHFLHLLSQAAELEARNYKRLHLLRRGA